MDGQGTDADLNPNDGSAQAAAPPAWTAQLPDDLKGNETFTGYKTIGDMARAYLDTSGKVAELEGKAAATQRPEKPEDYIFPAAQLPEGVKPNGEMEAWYRSTAHELGLSQEQAEGLFKKFNDMQISAVTMDVQNREKARVEAVDALKKEWGQAYDENIEVMKRAVTQFGGDDFKAFMDESGLGNNPVIIKTFVAIGKAMGEDKWLQGSAPADPKATPGMHYEIVDVRRADI